MKVKTYICKISAQHKAMRSIILTIVISCFIVIVYGQKPAFLTEGNQTWADSVFNSLSLDQKVGQLLMPRGNYSGKAHDISQLEKWVSQYHVGGIVMFATQPTTQAQVTNRLQSIAKTPLLIGQDLEWGLAMRLDSTVRFPYAMAIGAVSGHMEQLQKMGEEIGKQCKRMGIHVNYAPVVDVNINPDNPVINFRSFGGDKFNVAIKAVNIMHGMQNEKILCTAKHFPGHGDTDVDSHKALPIINHDRERLDNIELYPYKALIKGGLSGIMTAHLNIPALEPKNGLASTFSKSIITDLLRKDMGFEGLTFTDAMEMEGAVKNFPPGEAFVQAVLAGNDIIETFIDVPIAFESIKTAVTTGRIPMDVLNKRVRNILMAKSWVGLDKYAPIKIENLVTDLNSIESDVLNYQLAKASITCLRNGNNLIPIQDVSQKFAVVSLEGEKNNSFVTMIRNYVDPNIYYITKGSSSSYVDSLISDLKGYDFVIVGIHFTDIRPNRKYGLNDLNTHHIRKFIALKNAIVCMMASPFILKNIEEFNQCHTLLSAYQLTSYTESAVAQAIFGANEIKGTLPMTINKDFSIGMGIKTKSLGRLTYGPPEIVGLDRRSLIPAIDSIINSGLNAKAYPGCVAQIIHQGHVVYQKAHGYLTYTAINNQSDNYSSQVKKIDDAMDNFEEAKEDTKNANSSLGSIGKVDIHDSYDLASITKIAASTLALMRLTSANKFDINKRLSHYLPEAKQSNKGNLSMINMLTHRSGLQAWIPFWRHAVDTSLTWQSAVEGGMWPKDSIVVVSSNKVSWWKKLWGHKPSGAIDIQKSIATHPKLWDRTLSTLNRKWKNNSIQSFQNNEFTIDLGFGAYAHKDYPARIKKMILESPLGDTSAHKYTYSDLHFYLYPEIIENITNKSFENYLAETYHRLGAMSLTFNPSRNIKNIAPTEYDGMFRKHRIHGKVHDEGAILMGGISGHAGLFGNANDLSKLMFMYSKDGSYAGHEYIKPEVIYNFTKYAFPQEKNRRGIGFDKKDFDPKVTNAPSLSSDSAYGHSGFTGTYAWVDPKFELVYVFLSNRVYPTRNNSALADMKIRQSIGDVVIRAIMKKDL